MTRSSARTPAKAADVETPGGKTSTVYNSTDGPLAYDRAGRMVGARETVEVKDPTVSPISGHVAAGRFVVLNADDEADQGDVAGDQTQPDGGTPAGGDPQEA